MKVIQPVATEQNLVVRARANSAAVDLVLTKADTGTAYTYSAISTSYSDGFLTVPFTHDCNEGDRFDILLRTAGGATIFRGRALATAQTPAHYKLFG